MSGAQIAALVVLGIIAWGGLSLCLAVAVGLSIRDADRRALEELNARVTRARGIPAADDDGGPAVARLDVKA